MGHSRGRERELGQRCSRKHRRRGKRAFECRRGDHRGEPGRGVPFSAERSDDDGGGEAGAFLDRARSATLEIEETNNAALDRGRSDAAFIAAADDDDDVR
jgi:hypothetical protein